MSNGARLYGLDVAKGILILLVTIGHALQYIFPDHSGFLNDPLFRFIYMFHMPAFMAISGYLFHITSDSGRAQKAVKYRFVGAFFPGLAWGGLPILAYLWRNRATLPNSTALLFFIQRLESLWFLWALLFCTLFVYFIRRISGSAIILAGATICLLAVPDDSISLILDLKMCKFMLPFFVGGYLCKNIELNANSRRITLWIAACVFIYCGIFWEDQCFVYFSGSNFWEVGAIPFIMRLSAGAAGSILIVEASSHAFGNTVLWFTEIGKSSLVIYILQMQLFLVAHHLIPAGLFDLVSYWQRWGGAVLFASILTLLLNFLANRLLKNTILNLLLFGIGKKSK